MRSILDPKFKYTPAALTDLEATFRRIRAEIRARAAAQAQADTEAAEKTVALQPRRNAK